MSFDPIHVARPAYEVLLWPLACLSLIAVVSLLGSRSREAQTSARSRGLVAIHTFLIAVVLLCGVLTLLYHFRETEPVTRRYEAELRGFAQRNYLKDAIAFGIALGGAFLARTVRVRRMAVGGGGA